ncbi:KxDL motif-containing protein 1 [Maudiozyma exigua]|uniref:Biogenesis of lysosome-related organelles complex 1 subunit KXD1 n=1 Tax=Maudiozyma exigua TaxID=34358 RepID=A0A9P6WD90_MAUEX|nr:KxDL motif-containing protein 1 [Kazachstania exigua]
MNNDDTQDTETSRPQTPSINSQSYAIPTTYSDHDSIIGDADAEDTTSSSSEDDGDSNEVNSGSITPMDSQSFDAIDSIITDEFNENSTDEFLHETLSLSKNIRTIDNGNDIPPAMVDIPKQIFESLSHAIENVDFSETLALQTRISGTINFKSLELKDLIDKTQGRLQVLNQRYETGVVVSRKLKENLDYSKRKIDEINSFLGTEYPIEFNEARDKILERHFEDND